MQQLGLYTLQMYMHTKTIIMIIISVIIITRV